MNMKTMMAAFAAFAVAVAAADVPEITAATMLQSTMSRLVTIEYTLINAPAVVTLEVETNANPSASADDPGWTSIGGEAVCNAQGDVWRKVGESGTFNGTITWRPDHSWPGFKIPANGARAVVTAWPLDNTPDYMVVDVSSAAGANTQKYYPSADFVPGGVTNGLYKTGALLMRKIMAKGVTWMMGSVAESGRNATREATHQVTLTNNYYIGVYQVTQTQWQQVTGYNPSNFKTEGSMRPVEKVSYTDIRQGKGTESAAASDTGGVYPDKPHDDSFLGLLRDKTKLDFDLPSEAQWEFAARAGNGEGYWGDGSAISISSNKDAGLDQLGRYLNNPSSNSTTSPATTVAPAVGGTAIVGSYTPNAWGLYDMHGNLWEWCLDWFADDITGLNGTVNTVSATKHSVRGGSWCYGASGCRSAYRVSNPPSNRGSDNGFRLLCSAGLQ